MPLVGIDGNAAEKSSVCVCYKLERNEIQIRWKSVSTDDFGLLCSFAIVTAYWVILPASPYQVS